VGLRGCLHLILLRFVPMKNLRDLIVFDLSCGVIHPMRC
jgi:hypothetical protein